MALDGFIAGVGGDMSWLTDHLVPSGPESGDLVAGIGALLIGRRTFAGDDPNAARTRRVPRAAGGADRRSC